MTDDLSATIDRLEKARDGEYFASNPPLVYARRDDLAALLSAIEEARSALGPFAEAARRYDRDREKPQFDELAKRGEMPMGLSAFFEALAAARAAFERLGGRL